MFLYPAIGTLSLEWKISGWFIYGYHIINWFTFYAVLDNQQYVDDINQYPEGLLPWQFNNSREIGARVKEFYFGNKTISHQTVMQFANVSMHNASKSYIITYHIQYRMIKNTS